MNEQQVGYLLGWGVIAFLGLLAYFLPLVIAGARGHHSAGGIFVLNLFLGWTFLGWVIALIWACSYVRQPEPSWREKPRPPKDPELRDTPEDIDYVMILEAQRQLKARERPFDPYGERG